MQHVYKKTEVRFRVNQYSRVVEGSLQSGAIGDLLVSDSFSASISSLSAALALPFFPSLPLDLLPGKFLTIDDFHSSLTCPPSSPLYLVFLKMTLLPSSSSFLSDSHLLRSTYHTLRWSLICVCVICFDLRPLPHHMVCRDSQVGCVCPLRPRVTGRIPTPASWEPERPRKGHSVLVCVLTLSCCSCTFLLSG